VIASTREGATIELPFASLAAAPGAAWAFEPAQGGVRLERGTVEVTAAVEASMARPFRVMTPSFVVELHRAHVRVGPEGVLVLRSSAAIKSPDGRTLVPRLEEGRSYPSER
jgi:ferric-dicitrate binding protein FerR (iron transport regulator)